MQPKHTSVTTTRRLDWTEIDEAADVLARAFHNDPLQSYVFPDLQERQALSAAHFKPLIRYGLLAGEVWTTADAIMGVGVWSAPQQPAINLDLLTQAGYFQLPSAIGADAFQRFSDVIDFVEPFHRDDMSCPHWYAMVIGVDSSLQGQGIGGRLLEPVLANADREGVPCYLETCQRANVRFYCKHGFDLLRRGTEPKSGLGYWTFKRAPR